jgi:hypothetical protein
MSRPKKYPLIKTSLLIVLTAAFVFGALCLLHPFRRTVRVTTQTAVAHDKPSPEFSLPQLLKEGAYLEQLMNASKATDKIWASITWLDDARQSTLLGIIRKS